MFTSLINKCYLWICIVLNFVVTGSTVLEIFLRKEKFLTRGPKVLNSKLNVRHCTLTCQKIPYLQVNKSPQRRGKKDVVVKRICLQPWPIPKIATVTRTNILMPVERYCNTQVNYQNSSPHCLKVFKRVQVFKQKAKHQG